MAKYRIKNPDISGSDQYECIVKYADYATQAVYAETAGNVGTLNTNNSTAQSVSSSESFSGTIKLHKISKTGSYNDLLNKPDLTTKLDKSGGTMTGSLDISSSSRITFDGTNDNSIWYDSTESLMYFMAYDGNPISLDSGGVFHINGIEANGNDTYWTSNGRLDIHAHDLLIRVSETKAGSSYTGEYDTYLKIDPGYYGPIITAYDGSLSNQGYIFFDSDMGLGRTNNITVNYNGYPIDTYAHHIKCYYNSSTKHAISFTIFNNSSTSITTYAALRTAIYYGKRSTHNNSATSISAQGWANNYYYNTVLGVYANSTTGSIYAVYTSQSTATLSAIALNTSMTISDSVDKLLGA